MKQRGSFASDTRWRAFFVSRKMPIGQQVHQLNDGWSDLALEKSPNGGFFGRFVNARIEKSLQLAMPSRHEKTTFK
jgi:hypothetical protein